MDWGGFMNFRWSTSSYGKDGIPITMLHKNAKKMSEKIMKEAKLECWDGSDVGPSASLPRGRNDKYIHSQFHGSY